jgi:hypothetical protein
VVADTALAPALGIELNDLEPGMRAVRVTVIVQERQFLGPRRGAAIGTEDQGTDHFIAPLDLIHKVELELGKVEHGFHAGSLPVYTPRSAEAGAVW